MAPLKYMLKVLFFLNSQNPESVHPSSLGWPNIELKIRIES